LILTLTSCTGDHGIEFLLLKYEINGCLSATKITGDINVPRGEISWKCNLKDQVRICDEKEWNGKISYRAKTKVAYEGFRNPDEIDSEGFFFFERKFF
jgi:hypothetical protein